MNKHIFVGKWHEIKGRLKQRWGWLTEDDLTRIKGNSEEIYGILQKHYGYSRDEVKRCIKNFIKSASLQHFRSMALKGKKIVTDSVRENPVKAIILALSTGVTLGRLSSK